MTERLFINHQTINIMRKVSYAIAAALLFSAGNAFAAVDPDKIQMPNAKVSTQIESLLEEQNGFYLGEADELLAVVNFMVNDRNQIVVLSVDTPDERLERFVKARLNYEVVIDQSLKEGKAYKIPVRVRA